MAFEIVSSYAIAAAEFAHSVTLETHRGSLGLSWVAVWVVLFTVVVPTSPRRAVVAGSARELPLGSTMLSGGLIRRAWVLRQPRAEVPGAQ